MNYKLNKNSWSRYVSTHQWLNRHYKKTKCDFCDITHKRLQWAVKKGCQIEKDRNNFIVLCSSCHQKYDYTEERRNKMSMVKKGKKIMKRWKPVSSIDREGNVEKYQSVFIASESTGILKTSIVNCLSGRSNSAGKRKWVYEQL
jgi:hypothetical protein